MHAAGVLGGGPVRLGTEIPPGGCCHLGFLATLDGVPPMARSFGEAILGYQAIQLSGGVRARLVTRRRTWVPDYS